MIDDWKKLQVSLGLVAAVLIALAGVWGWAHSEFVRAEEYREFKRSLEVRSLERDKKQVELEVLKLEVKQEVYPRRFDAIDKAILKRQKADLIELNRSLKEIKRR